MVRGRRWAEPRVWMCVGQRGSAPQLAPAKGLVLSSAPGQMWGAGPREGGGCRQRRCHVHRVGSRDSTGPTAPCTARPGRQQVTGMNTHPSKRGASLRCTGGVPARLRSPAQAPRPGQPAPRPVLLPPSPADPLPGPQCAHPTTLWGFRVPEARGPHPRSVSSGQLCPSGKQVRVPRVPQAEWTQWDILSTWLAPRGLGLLGTAVSRITGPGDGVAEGEAPETSWSLAHCTQPTGLLGTPYPCQSPKAPGRRRSLSGEMGLPGSPCPAQCGRAGKCTSRHSGLVRQPCPSADGSRHH